MALTPEEKLRQMLGEEIPAGGSEGETMFSEEKIRELIADNPNLDRAAYEGWRVKAAKLASLVDSSEGNRANKFSQLHAQALEMVKMYQRSSEGATEGRTRVGRIRRAPLEWS